MTKLAIAGLVVTLALGAIPVITFLAVVTAIAGGGAADINLCATDANLATILTTIRQLESSNRYDAQAGGSSASGAYQITDGTWDGYAGYERAVDAPPEVQDQKAVELVRSYLQANATLSVERRAQLNTDTNPVVIVPIMHYWPKTLIEPQWMDHIPRPDAGNELTVGEYQARWLDEYARQSARGADGGLCLAGFDAWAGGPLLDHLPNCGNLGWGGYTNGHVPHEAMRWRPFSGHLHPAASASYDQLYAAAQAAGYDLRGGGYASAGERQATSGTSCHGVGLAIDVWVLDPGPGAKYSSVDEVFTSAEFAWVCANAPRYGWVVPRWAMPTGMRCGPVTGNGVGGYVGNTPGQMEPWHLEAVGIATTHPDFAPKLATADRRDIVRRTPADSAADFAVSRRGRIRSRSTRRFVARGQRGGAGRHPRVRPVGAARAVPHRSPVSPPGGR